MNVWRVPINAISGKVTGAPYRVTDVARIYGFFLSPDASDLAYPSDRKGAMQIWMKDLISGKRKVVITSPGNLSGLVFLYSGTTETIAHAKSTAPIPSERFGD